MALTVSISGVRDIAQGGQITLTATVTDENGNPASGDLTFAWSTPRGTFIGNTAASTVIYHANFMDAAPAQVSVTCEVTRAAHPNPTIASATLTSLSDIGITGILVNMLLTDLGAVSDNANNVLYNEGATGTLAANSDDDLSNSIHIIRVRWNSSANAMVINSSGVGNLGNFFTGNTTQSLFVVFDDGVYFELDSTDFMFSGATWAGWNVTDAPTRLKLNSLVITSDLVIGIADSGSIGLPMDSGAQTEAFLATVPEPKSIAMVHEQSIVIDTDYSQVIAITGNPEDVEVSGDMEYFGYDWEGENDRVRIEGHPEKEFSGVWNIKASYSDGIVLTEDVHFNVIAATPVFGMLPDIHLYRDVDININVPIANPPSEIVAKTLLLELGARLNETGVKVDGVIPADNVFTVVAGTMMFEAPHVGGAVMGSYGYEIQEGTPPALGAVSQVPRGDFAVLEFTDVQHALEYEWAIDNGEGVDFLSWNLFGPNRGGIDLDNLTVTPGNLEATITFPHVTGATRYEWIKEGGQNWTSFAAMPVNNLISVIIPGLIEGETIRVFLRVAGPWVGSIVSVEITGGRLMWALHEDNTASDAHALYLFTTGTRQGAVASLIKRVLLPNDVDSPTDIAVDFSDNHVYVADNQGRFINVFDLDVNDGAMATRLRKFTVPTGVTQLVSISLYGDILYTRQGQATAGIESFSKNTANGAVATRINLYGTGFNNRFSFAADASEENLYYLNRTSGSSTPFVTIFPRTPVDFSNAQFTQDIRLRQDVFENVAFSGIGREATDSLAVVGNIAYVIGSNFRNQIWLFDISKNSQNAEQYVKFFTAPSGCNRIVGLSVDK